MKRLILVFIALLCFVLTNVILYATGVYQEFKGKKPIESVELRNIGLEVQRDSSSRYFPSGSMLVLRPEGVLSKSK